MEQWVTKICELGDEKNDCKEKEATREMDVNIVANGTIKQPNDQEDPNPKNERYQDVSPSTDTELPDKSPIEPTVTNEESHESSNVSVSASSQSHSPIPPPLPARIPQRLPIPSLQHSPQEFPDEEEDDIYHKIEDFRDTVRYGNVSEASQIKMNDDRSDKESSATYDDIQASVKKKDKFDEKSKGKSIVSRDELTYDDTGTTLKDNKVTDEQDKFSSYDDVESVINSKSNKVRTTRKTEELTKSPQKRSFLDRVRSKKESPKKIEKKAKCKTIGSPSRLPPLPPPLPPQPLANNHESSTYYDDVSGLTNVEQQANRFEEQQSEYTCPPPPRPIYAKPPMTENTIDADEFYDDIACRDKSDIDKSYQQTTKRPSLTNTDRPAFCENVDRSQQTFEDDEHYKTPRPDSHYPKCHPVDHQTNDLYDDVAILAEFTTRQKEILSSREKDNEGTTKLQTSPEKKPWNRFVGGRRSKAIDSSIAEGNGRVSQGTEGSSDELNEQHNSLRMNTFQKLISRMESSLGKASSRTTSSILNLNKANLTNSG
ncbi:hypothetical protein E2986_03104 [Frieseomelitta varia]|uniref:Uncharacterized protein n=3 Tax=Frieseomelitta varia TaxID=561572 RepID=A0A833RNB7_9HYME|nr:hypothetical protein E2986_03104 [Frieseomelitta varia]